MANRRLQAELEAKAKDVEYMVQQNENKEKLIEVIEVFFLTFDDMGDLGAGK